MSEALDLPDVDRRFTHGLIFDVFGVLDRHGYRPDGDPASTGRAVEALLKLARVYEGGTW